MRSKLIKLLLILFLLFSILILLYNFTTPNPTQNLNVNVYASIKIDINKCTKEDLNFIPGIGLVKSESIIKYREQNGNFKSVSQLDNVRGIGAKTIETLKNYVEVK